MIPVVGMFRGLFLGSVLVWYSSSVWKTMDNYYNEEFKKYLQKEKEERRFPSEEDVCRAVPDAQCGANAAADDAATTHTGGAVDVEALGASKDPPRAAADADDGAAGGHAEWGHAEWGHEEGVAGACCTVTRDVTHTDQCSQHQTAVDSCAREEEADREFQEQPEDYKDTCPVRF